MASERVDRQSLRQARDFEALAQAREARTHIEDDFLIQAGLSPAQVQERNSLGLNNAVSQSASRSLLNILRSNLLTLFNAVVGGSFLLLLFLGQWRDALFGFAVIANVLIGVIQEYNSKRTLDRIAILNQPRARVLREGNEVEVAVSEVLLDDLLILRAGDQVSADAVVLDASEFEVDESLLTGESDPIEKCAHDALLSGSNVIAGSARARVVKVGIESYSNMITQEARRFSMVKSELRNALARIVRWISWALIPLMLIALNGQMQVVGGWQHAFATGAWAEAAVSSIASIISMIPQGLVLITSISFALAAVSLARKKVLVQELPAVEGLARVDVVCFDKTGTLTDGEISFKSLVALDQSVPEAEIARVLARFASDPAANATAQALRAQFASNERGSVERIPFNSTRKWSAVSVKAGEWWVLGAPEFTLQSRQSGVLERAAQLALEGNRVLALLRVHGDRDAVTADLNEPTPVALLTFGENVRTSARETIEYFRTQGLSLKVISGDSPLTVGAVAAAAGLQTHSDAIDARELPTEFEALAEVLRAHDVFGRVTPEQKKQMVLALQSAGHVVAMTGDGVNDALALKVADLGVAMGNGSAATKAVSRIVLLDNAFENFPMIVGEGRRVIANVERVSRLFLTKTTWAMMLALVFGLSLWAFPFLPRQLSGVDGYTIGIAAFLLALLPNKRRYVPGFLKRSLMFCIPSGLIIGTAVTLLTLHTRSIMSEAAESQTAVAITLSLTGLWVLVTLSRPYDRYKLAITAGMYVLFILMFTVPLSRDFFGFVPLPGDVLTSAFVASGAAIIGIEIVVRIVDRILNRSTSLAR